MSNDDVYKFPGLQSQQGGVRSGRWYDIAQVCLNGDVISTGLIQWPESAQPYCERCGEATISQCPSCHTAIKGNLHEFSVYTLPTTAMPPKFCYACGAMYPWTARHLDAARELTDELALTDDEKETIKERLPDIAQDTPTAEVSALKLKRLLDKARGAGSVAAGVLYKMAIDYASETTKKILTGP